MARGESPHRSVSFSDLNGGTTMPGNGARGGRGTRHGINVLNDTGSDLLTIFYTDLALMGALDRYEG